jgi:hypothetical protein
MRRCLPKTVFAAADVVSVVVVLLAFTSGRADAMADYQSLYGYQRTWNAALRLVRVDNGWKVTEKDEPNGYLLFEYHSIENSKATYASIELIRGDGADAPVSVLVRIPQMPHYHEQVIADALASKMRREYGDPPVARVKVAPEEPTPDGGESPDE